MNEEDELIDLNLEENQEQNEEQQQEQVQAYDYYDRYYEQVLSNMTTIKTNQETIIRNQDEIIEQNKTRNLFSGSILFMICLIFIYYVLRKMIK